MTERKSNSTGGISSLLPWLKENYVFFKNNRESAKYKVDFFKGLLVLIDDYAKQYLLQCGSDLKTAKILEVGYGARPNLMIALMSLGYDVVGIDLDRPVLKGNLSEFMDIYKSNGIKRLIKSLLRNMLFDRDERSALKQVLEHNGYKLKIESSRFFVGGADSLTLPPHSIDFIYSRDVFEHIPPDSMHQLCKNLVCMMSDNAVAIISPAVFTGICGGHLVGWYPQDVESNESKQLEPWEHLRKRRAQPDCYLNEMRIGDYYKIFETYFEVVSVINQFPEYGRRYLTDEIKNELFEYSEAELLSNQWSYVLRKPK